MILNKIAKYNVSAHWDADGIYSAALFHHSIGIDKLIFPVEFGDFEYDTTIMIDMKPINKAKPFVGLCFDHHPFEEKEKLSFELIWDSVPTSLIIWKQFKDKIEKHHWWKVVGGLMGDNQIYYTPDVIWKLFPSLLSCIKSVYRKGSNITIYDLPLWNYLSSGVNAMSKIGAPFKAYEIVRDATSPLDIIYDSELLDARDKVTKIVNDILNNTRIIDVDHKIIFVPINTEYNVQGEIATTIESRTKKTVICVNTFNNKVSLRGVLASLLSQNIKTCKIDGHAGFMGGNLLPDNNVDGLLNELYNISKVI